jgi:hypothetical protein
MNKKTFTAIILVCLLIVAICAGYFFNKYKNNLNTGQLVDSSKTKCGSKIIKLSDFNSKFETGRSVFGITNSIPYKALVAANIDEGTYNVSKPDSALKNAENIDCIIKVDVNFEIRIPQTTQTIKLKRTTNTALLKSSKEQQITSFDQLNSYIKDVNGYRYAFYNSTTNEEKPDNNTISALTYDLASVMEYTSTQKDLVYLILANVLYDENKTNLFTGEDREIEKNNIYLIDLKNDKKYQLDKFLTTEIESDNNPFGRPIRYYDFIEGGGDSFKLVTNATEFSYGQKISFIKGTNTRYIQNGKVEKIEKLPSKKVDPNQKPATAADYCRLFNPVSSCE